MNFDPKNYRIDASEKIRGEIRYTNDLKIPGLWQSITIRSPYPRAKILEIQFDSEFDWNTVTVVTASDIPNNYVAMLENDMPYLASKIVNYVGEPVALITAPDKNLLERASNFLHVIYEPLSYLTNMLDSEKSEVLIFSNNNIFKEIKIEKGDLEKIKQNNYKKVEIEVHTGFQEHLYLEPQCVIAIPEKDRVVIRGSLQCPYYVKNAVETMFDGKKHITVIHAPTGGAFGGKEDYPSLIAGHAALLAVKSGHPVAVTLDRFEDIQYTPKRHPSYHHEVAYVDKNGKIQGLEIQMYLNGGAYCTLSQVVLARAALTVTGCYYVPNVRIHAKAVATNIVPSGAFRGFGGPQAVFAIEMLMEKIACVLDLSPKKVREINLISKGQETATGQILKYSVSSQEVFEDVISRSDFDNKYRQYKEWNHPILEKLIEDRFPKNKNGGVLKGIGISASVHGAGFTGVGENKIKGVVRLELEQDGAITVYSAQTEMGQGQQTAFQKILSEALHIKRKQIKIAEVNTDVVPDSGPTVASRSTMVVGSLLVEAAKEIVEKLKLKLKNDFGVEFQYRQGYFYRDGHILSFTDAANEFGGFSVEKQYSHPSFIKFDETTWKGDAYPVFSWAAAVAEIEVDPITFQIKVTRYYTTHDIGKAINYDQAVAQIEGGSLQGIGYALYEKITEKDGLFDITGFSDYIIPSFMETPEFHIKILENPYPFGPFGAKGLGELPNVGSAPAIISALWMIFESEFNKIPVLPEDLHSIFLHINKRNYYES